MNDAGQRLTAALSRSYRIERELGQGGMATVYLAEDLKHRRKVAVKVLRPELAASLGPERFLREIEVAAQLQHPHILPLHDSGEAEGFLYYVMPYVEGNSLRDRLAHHGELPVHEAIKILSEVADGLAYAHSRGVVHRDIKPDNIMLSGRHALITDFGVAKAVSDATGRLTLTTAGVALGTPVYMAPEQATADPHLDHRVDIYALGVVAYELLTGRPPFTGVTAQQVLAAHVTEEPEPVTRHRPAISPALAQVIMKCLAKRPADRWQSADELLAQLEPLLTPSGGMTPTATRPSTALKRGNRSVLWVAGAVGVTGLLAIGFKLWHRVPGTVSVGKRSAVTLESGLEQNPAVSPDGRMMAYRRVTTTERRLYVQQLGGGAPVPVTPPSLQVLGGPPSWSPDGTRLLFSSDRGLEVVPALGGALKLILPIRASHPFAWGAWSPDGSRVAYSEGDSLCVTELDRPVPRALVVGGEPNSPAWSPNGEWIAYVSGNIQYASLANLAPSAVWVVRSSGGKPVRITEDRPLNSSPVWLPDGRSLLFVSNRDGGRDVYQVHLRSSGEPDGPVVRLTTGLNPHTISLSADGQRLVYAVSTEIANVYAITIQPGRAISLAAARPITSGTQVTEGLSVSPDGRWLAFDSDRSGNQDIWRMPLDGSGPPEQLTTTPLDEFQPAFSPDGQRIAFHQTRSGSVRDLFSMSASGGAPERIAASTENNFAPRWAADGRALVHVCGAANVILSCVTILDQDGRHALGTRQIAVGASDSTSTLDWSPDGRWIAVWNAPLFGLLPPAGGNPHPLGASPPGFDGFFLRWSPDGRTIYANGAFPDGRYSILAIPVSGGPVREIVRSEEPTAQTFRFGFDVHGNTLYMSLAGRQSDIWMAEVEKAR